jgi:hypothetical protein
MVLPFFLQFSAWEKISDISPNSQSLDGVLKKPSQTSAVFFDT